MKLKSVILICIVSIIVSCNSETRPDLFKKLDSTLDEKAVYDSYFSERVKVLRDILSEQTESEQIYNINCRLADTYRVHNVDSVIFYLKNAKAAAVRMNAPDLAARAELKMAETYVKAGYSIESNAILEMYRGRALSDEILIDYYSAEHAYWGETVAYSAPGGMSEHRWEMRDKYRNLVLERIGEGTWEWHNLKREEVDEIGDIISAREHALAMIGISPENSREYAEASYFYAHTYRGEDEQMFHEWLLRSAIADIMCATKDYASLNEISQILFNRGDIDRAFRYAADHCMRDAIYFNGKLRPWQVSQFFPVVERAYQTKHSRQNKTTVALLVSLSLLTVLLMFLILFLHKRQQILDSMRARLQKSYLEIDNRNHELVAINSRLVSLNAKIQEADKVKQEYITLFLGIVSDNISTTRQYKNKVLKYIRQGNLKAITDEIENLPSIDNDILDFYKMFDQTFVNLYPDFVEKFNELLVDGAAIIPKGDDILTPELRIFALIKLGISDSSRIASLLHYSANTIYNYRAKTKNKARGSRGDFEEAVRNID